MLATRLHGREDVRLEEVPDVVPDEGEVRVKVAYNGICGTDLHFYFRGGAASGAPITLGHEFAGVVDAVGAGVVGIAPGTVVAVRPMLACGRCDTCRRGLTHLCAPPDVLGCGSARGGGLAEHCVAPVSAVFPLPASVGLEQGALVEPMSVAFNGVRRSEAEPGMQAVIFGAGPIGIGVYLGLRARDVDDVVVVEPAVPRRDAIAALGASEVLDPRTDDVRGAVLARTGGGGADVVFECAGVQASFAQAMTLGGPRARVVTIAVYEDSIEWNPSALMGNEVEIRGAKGYAPGVFEEVIGLMAQGNYPTTGWVEHIPWSALVEEGLVPLRRGERMKVLVDVEA